MSTQYVDITACSFPQLRVKEVEKVQRSSSLEIDYTSLGALEDVFVNDRARFNGILRVCWALVLRCYTGIDTVSFVYEEEISPGGSGVSLHVMDIRASESIANLLDREETTVAAGEDIWTKVNSAVLIRKVTGTAELQRPTKTVVSSKVRLRAIIPR